MTNISGHVLRLIFLVLIIFSLINFKLIYHSSSKISRRTCQRSMTESDGYFCESDDKWSKRRTFYSEQHEKNLLTMNEYEHYFERNWIPEFHCDNEIRLGEKDGGKWACDTEYLSMKRSCLIYSLGSGRDFRFEEAVHQRLPRCSIHTIDMQYTVCPQDVCTFHHVRLGDGLNGTKTLRQLMAQLNHTGYEIDILKIDIEYSEYVFFHTLFSNNELNRSLPPIYIRQILLEVHLDRHRLFETNALFYLLNSHNYVIYHRELNPSFSFFACEYGFFRLNKLFFQGHC